jgi:hypothetical protein
MEKFVMEIDFGNDAMQTRSHLIRALKNVVKQIEDGMEAKKILDQNGNAVGKWEIV